jgi:hypothetical protein
MIADLKPATTEVHRGREEDHRLIDEAHSSQGGRTSAAISVALSEARAEEDDETIGDENRGARESTRATCGVARSKSKPRELLLFFVDRSLGKKRIAEAMRAAGAQVHVHDDFFAPGAPDVEWLQRALGLWRTTGKQ